MRFSRLSLAIPFLMLPVSASADERRIMLTAFDSIRVEGPFEVEVTTDGSTGARVSGDRRALDSVDLRVEDRVLVVTGSQNGWGGWPDARQAPARITATAPAIRRATVVGSSRVALDRLSGQNVGLSISGSGVIAVRDVRADELEAVVTGTGKLALQGNVARASFLSNGVNSIDAAGLTVRDLTVQSESAGEASFAASETATVTALGIGPITVTGPAACTISGPGPVRCGR
ncbi:GIN domain-containing protein [Sphingomonas sp.]